MEGSSVMIVMNVTNELIVCQPGEVTNELIELRGMNRLTLKKKKLQVSKCSLFTMII